MINAGLHENLRFGTKDTGSLAHLISSILAGQWVPCLSLNLKGGYKVPIMISDIRQNQEVKLKTM